MRGRRSPTGHRWLPCASHSSRYAPARCWPPRRWTSPSPTARTDGAWRLSIERKGSLEDLAIIPSPGGDRPLGVHEVRIGVRAAGLNFRDVLIALGLYPGDAPLGSEAAGVVLEVGPGVTDLSRATG